MADYMYRFTVQGCKSGLGIRVIGPSTDTGYGVFIKSVTADSLAERDGQLRLGDKLVRVGEQELTGMTQRQAIDVLKQEAQTDTMTFIIDRSQDAAEEFNVLMTQAVSEIKSTSTSSIVGPTLSSVSGEDESGERGGQEEVTEEHVPVSKQLFTDTIVIEKRTHLGISVVGGEGSPEGPHISIRDITEGGDAHTDGRLEIGDVILSINGFSFQNMELNKALQLLTRMKISRRTLQYTIEFQRLGFIPTSDVAPEGQDVSSEVRKTSDTEGHISDGLDTKRSSRLRSSDSKQKHGRKRGIQRKISLDPHCKVKLTKLEKALNYLGYTPSEEQRAELHNNLDIDEDGYVTYLDFVNEAKRLFAITIDERQLSSGLYLLGSKPKEDKEYTEKEVELEPEQLEPASSEEKQNTIPDLLEEIAILNKMLETAEAQNVSSKVIQSENEKTIRRLVAELQQQRNQTPAPKHDSDVEELNRKISIMDCEYRKLDWNVKRYEVACEKLLQFCQLVHENLSEAQGAETFVNYPRGIGESARRGNAVLGNPRPPAGLANHTKFTNITLAQEAQETVAAARKIISQASVLPKGWEEAYTDDGLKFYMNHETQTTTWLHPVTKTGHTKFSLQGEVTAPFTQPPKF